MPIDAPMVVAPLPADGIESRPIVMAVMDPLAAPLCCACVDGVGQRDYGALAKHLESQLGRPVDVVFAESLHFARQRSEQPIDLVVGQDSVVRFDAATFDLVIEPLAALTGRQGRTHVCGLLVARADDERGLKDIPDGRLVLGPVENEETHAAMRAAIGERATEIAIETSIEAAVFRVTDGEADVTAVPDFLPPLLEGCGKIAPGSLRVVGRTEPVPFVRVFATSNLDPESRAAIRGALGTVAADAELLEALESRDGFVAVDDVRSEPVVEQTAEVDEDESTESTEWTDWRGSGRRGLCPTLPKLLPANPRRFWSVKLTGPAMAGIAATRERVFVADKSADRARDIFLCLAAKDGRELWRLEYDAAGRVDYTNAPRATPVVHDGLVYLHGALGDLHCCHVDSGRVVWRTNILTEFGADPITWGSSVPPLVVDDLLIVNPGAREASVVALDRRTGKTVWKAPGHAAAYAPFIVGTFGGTRQIIGYDSAGLGGWDPKTGRRLWELVPPGQVDFHVGTPIDLGDGRLLVATENNATRVYAFADDGTIRPEPVLVNEDLAPDSPTPVVLGDRVFSTAFGAMFELDLADDLATVWDELDDLYYDHCNLIAGNGRVLLWTTTGDLLLLRADAGRHEIDSRLRPFDGDRIETMSHPAIVGDRLYLRHQHELVCLSLTESTPATEADPDPRTDP